MMSEQERRVILHISDLHFGSESEQECVYRDLVLCELTHALDALPPEWKPNIVCITGDVAARGQSSDYVDAGRWLDELCSKLSIKKDAVVICPGNHDVDLSVQLPSERTMEHKDADQYLAVPLREGYTQRFQAFTDWCKQWGVTPLTFGGADDNYLVGSRSLKRIQFVVLNSAWFSCENDNSGKLWLGRPHIMCMERDGQLPRYDDLKSSPVTITMFHHSPSDLAVDECDTSRDGTRPGTFDYLFNRCHMVLTGHRHRKARPPDLLGLKTLYFEAGATYESSACPNSVRLIQLEDCSVLYRLLEYAPSSLGNRWEPKSVSEKININRWPEDTSVEETLRSDTRLIEESIDAARQAVLSNDEIALRLDQPKMSLPNEAECAVKYIVEEIGRLSASLEFDKATCKAEELDRLLAKNIESLPAELISKTYHKLCRFEMDKARYNHSNDLTKARYYLEKANGAHE